MKNPSTARRVAPGSVRSSPTSGHAAQFSLPAPLAATVAVIAAVLVYLPALRNGFIWDDPLVLEQLRAFRSFGDFLVMPPAIPRFYYRPLIFVSYLIDRALGGETPFWFHVSVIAFHALNCLLVFRLAERLFPGDRSTSTAAAVLFAVFPTHVESVAWIAGRSDVIVCTFLLLTVLLFMRREVAWTAWLGSMTFFLALLSKEMAVAGGLIVPLLDRLSTQRLYWQRYLSLFVACIVYFALRQYSGGALVGGGAMQTAPAQLTLDILGALGFYTIRSVAPVGLSAYIPTVPDATSFVVTGLLLPLATVALLYVAWRQQRWGLAYLMLWFLLMLAPSLTVIVRRSASAPVADRYLYVPSVASSMLAAWAIVHMARRWRLPTTVPLGVIAMLSIVLGIETATYARVWTDNFTFWSDVATKIPQSALAQRQLALGLLDRGQLDDAERTLQRVLTLPSDEEGRVMAYSNLGLIYRRQSRFADAVHAFESALQIAPHPALYHNLGMTLMAKAEQAQRQGTTATVAGDVQQARTAFEAALTLKDVPGGQTFLQQWDPAKTHSLLGQVLFSLGDRVAAREHLETALRLQPTGPIADATRRYLQQAHL